MIIRPDRVLLCIGCDKSLPLNKWEPDVFEAQCHDCKALYRLRVATYRQSTQ